MQSHHDSSNIVEISTPAKTKSKTQQGVTERNLQIGVAVSECWLDMKAKHACCDCLYEERSRLSFLAGRNKVIKESKNIKDINSWESEEAGELVYDSASHTKTKMLRFIL